MPQATQPAGVTVTPLAAAVGAEIRGIDLSGDIDKNTYDWIHQAVIRHGVLVFRGQDLDAPRFHAFASRFGPLQVHVLRKYRHKDFPGLSWLTNVEADGSVDRFGVTRATAWHTDGSFTDDPPTLGILHAKEVPSKGGGTLFASMKAAYSALPDDRKAALAALTGLHRHGAGPGGGMYDDSLDDDQEENHKDVRPPAVRPHPVDRRARALREPDAYPCLRGHEAGGERADHHRPHRRRHAPRAGLSPRLAAGRPADLGRARHPASRRRRL